MACKGGTQLVPPDSLTERRSIAIDLFERIFYDFQVVQKPDEATVAFSYADAADLPPGTAQPHSSL